MGEVLSQSEIDNLLAALSSGELDVDQMQEPGEKQVKDYDFKRPAKFSKEHLRTLEIIYEHYGRLISTNLPVYFEKKYSGDGSKFGDSYLFRIYKCTFESGYTWYCRF